MYIEDFQVNPDDEEQNFLQYVSDVRNDFDAHRSQYQSLIQNILPEEIQVVHLRLGGDYASGMMPYPDSPIDLEVLYFPLENITPGEVEEALQDKIEGLDEPFSIVPFEIDDLDEEEPYQEVQSDLFRQSGVNATDIHQVRRITEEMYEFGWEHFNPVRGIIQTVDEQDIEEFLEAQEEGYENELAWSRELMPEDLGLTYVNVEDGHHRAWAAKNTGLPIKVYQ
jgi:hypothetical protein